MGETISISKMANFVFDEIFKFFRWEPIGPQDQNFACEKSIAHKCITHPTDTVFHSSNPYTGEENYINVDLKSYAKDSISKAQIRDALNSLARTVECLRISQPWQDKYTKTDTTKDLSGLLFIYNHDGTFNHDFESMLNGIPDNDIVIPKGVRLYIMGPHTISYLLSIINDSMRIKIPDNYKFYYPNLVINKTPIGLHNSASIETILGPFQVITYNYIKQTPEGGSITKRHVVYYNGKTGTVDDFKYLLDFLFRFQLVGSGQEIDIRNYHHGFEPQFKIAKDEYFKYYFRGYDQMKDVVNEKNLITYNEIHNIIKKFSESSVSMRDRTVYG